jgi:hypothetical protein
LLKKVAWSGGAIPGIIFRKKLEYGWGRGFTTGYSAVKTERLFVL